MKLSKVNRIAKRMLLILYLFVLSVTTFHHHPFDFADKTPFYKTHTNETSSHHYTIDDCPIINFSNTGFNSFGISFFSAKFQLENIFDIVPSIVRFSSQNFFNLFFLRAPPFDN